MNEDDRSRYRMPVVFGPTAGPRQGPLGQRFDYTNARRETAAVSFLTDPALLSRYLPPRCQLAGEPVVTVERATVHELQWLAGRGYNTLGVKFPVVYQGQEKASGPFLSVLWENMAEPIISGREELGYAKLFCELPPVRKLQQAHHYTARWDGHEFMRLSLTDLQDAPPPPPPSATGVLHHRYLPRIAGETGAAVDEMVITPTGGFSLRYNTFQRGTGKIEFVESSWEQLPTMFHIVNALAGLPILEYQGAWFSETLGGKDLSDQRVLK